MSCLKSFMFWSTFLAVICMDFTNGFPTTDSIVISTVEESNVKPTTATPQNETEPTIPKITSMYVNSNISARYANTLVTSRVYNPAKRANEVTFSVVIPETAFITGFSMEIDGKVYDAYVKEKEEAKRVYDSAVSSGQSAAHVAVQARDSNHFTVSINLEPESKAIFRLKYEELLVRRLNLYNHVINLNPGQILDKLSVDVNIIENSPISILLVPELRTGNEIDAEPTDKPNEFAVQSVKDDKLSANIHFSPTKAQQLELMELFNKKKEKETGNRPSYHSMHNDPFENKDEGISGQFVVQYDVEADDNGVVLVKDGYFVHFFAPKSITPLSKHVIFVLDVSGSMFGKKIIQLKDAMSSILQELNPKDFFNIIEFSYNAKVYDLDNSTNNVVYGSRSNSYFYDEPREEIQTPETKPPKAKPASEENIKKAKVIINQLNANGGTNIHEALSTALRVANYGIEVQQPIDGVSAASTHHEPIIIFLTDGDPTVGETSTDKILSTMKTLNIHHTALFSLAFGEDADRNFLRKLSLQNYGFMRHIYEASDAALQLKNFYRQVSSPLLSKIQYIYPDEEVDNNTVTLTNFNHFFMGSELIVAGKLADTENITLPIVVSGNSENGPIDFTPKVINIQKKRDFWPLERLWAYLAIKQLLDESEAREIKDLKKKALEIALKYSFVTPLTSLVVVKPNSTASVDPEALPGTGIQNRYGSSYALPLIAGGAGAQRMSISAPASSFGSPGAPGLSFQSAYRPGQALAASYSPISTPKYTQYSSRQWSPMATQISPMPPPRAGFISSGYSSSHQYPTSGHRPNPVVHLDSRVLSGYPDQSGRTGSLGTPLSSPPFDIPIQQDSFAQFESDSYDSIPESLTDMRKGAKLGGNFGVRDKIFGGLDTRNDHSFDEGDSLTTALSDDQIEHDEQYTFSTEGNRIHKKHRGNQIQHSGVDSYVPTTTIVETTTIEEVESKNKLSAYGLENFSWLEQYLNSDNNTIAIPSNGQLVTYKLKNKSDNIQNIDATATCDNSVSGGSGFCTYLTQCNELNEAFKDLITYSKYSCDLVGYAGICCKVEL